MSRTDAHAPYWTWAVWYTPVHTLHGHKGCNLPDSPTRSNHRLRPGYPHDGWMDCFWGVAWPSYRECRWLYFMKPSIPRWYINHLWNGPERVRVRDGLRNLAREYNSYGDIEDDDFPNWQARNCARWSWD